MKKKPIDFEADAEVTNVSEANLSRVSKLAREQINCEQKVALAELDLASSKAALTKIRDQDLPQALEDAGVKELTLRDGSKVAVGDMYFASIPELNEAKALQWMQENELDSLIKTLVTATFGRGEDLAARALIKYLKEKGLQYSAKRGIHPQTLNALAKECAEAGKPLPEDLFKVHLVHRTKVKVSTPKEL